jgi:hypothetical protein
VRAAVTQQSALIYLCMHLHLESERRAAFIFNKGGKELTTIGAAWSMLTTAVVCKRGGGGGERGRESPSKRELLCCGKRLQGFAK